MRNCVLPSTGLKKYKINTYLFVLGRTWKQRTCPSTEEEKCDTFTECSTTQQKKIMTS